MSLKKGSSIAMTASTQTHQTLKLKRQTRERSYVECEVECEHTDTSESEVVMTDKRQELGCNDRQETGVMLNVTGYATMARSLPDVGIKEKRHLQDWHGISVATVCRTHES